MALDGQYITKFLIESFFEQFGIHIFDDPNFTGIQAAITGALNGVIAGPLTSQTIIAIPDGGGTTPLMVPDFDHPGQLKSITPPTVITTVISPFKRINTLPPPSGFVWGDLIMNFPGAPDKIPVKIGTTVYGYTLNPLVDGAGDVNDVGPTIPGLTFVTCTLNKFLNFIIDSLPDSIPSIPAALLKRCMWDALNNEDELPEYIRKPSQGILAHAKFRDLFYILERFGRYKSDRFREFLRKTIVDSLVRNYPNWILNQNFTFQKHLISANGKKLADFTEEDKRQWDPTLEEMFQITGIHFSCIAANVTAKERLVMNWEETPGLNVSQAIVMSSSAQFFLFTPQHFPDIDLDKETPDYAQVYNEVWLQHYNAKRRAIRTKTGDLITDGGIVDNYPYWIFSERMKTPYVEDLGNDTNRKKIGFFFDDRQPGNEITPDLRLDGDPAEIQALQFRDITPKGFQSWYNILHFGWDTKKTSEIQNSYDANLLAYTDETRQVTVFIPLKPIDWLSFSGGPHTIAEVCARGWLPAKAAMNITGWIPVDQESEDSKVPQFFTNVKCSNIELPPEVSPTITKSRDGLNIFGIVGPDTKMAMGTILETWANDTDLINKHKSIQINVDKKINLTAKFPPYIIEYYQDGIRKLFGLCAEEKIILFQIDLQAEGELPILNSGSLTASDEQLTNRQIAFDRLNNDIVIGWVDLNSSIRIKKINLYDLFGDTQMNIDEFFGSHDRLGNVLKNSILLKDDFGQEIKTDSTIALKIDSLANHILLTFIDTSKKMGCAFVDLTAEKFNVVSIDTDDIPIESSISSCIYGDPDDLSDFDSTFDCEAYPAEGWVNQGYIVCYLNENKNIKYILCDRNLNQLVNERYLLDDFKRVESAKVPSIIGCDEFDFRRDNVNLEASFWSMYNVDKKVFGAKIYGLNRRDKLPYV